MSREAISVCNGSASCMRRKGSFHPQHVGYLPGVSLRGQVRSHNLSRYAGEVPNVHIGKLLPITVVFGTRRPRRFAMRRPKALSPISTLTRFGQYSTVSFGTFCTSYGSICQTTYG